MDHDYELQREIFLLCPSGKYDKLSPDERKKLELMAEQQVIRQRKLKEIRSHAKDGAP